MNDLISGESVHIVLLMAKYPQFFCVILTSLFCASSASAGLNTGVNGLGKENSKLGNQRFERRMWQSERNSDLMQKSFPLQEWDKHFSGLGAKRAGISMKEDRNKKIFKTNTKEFPIKEYDLAGWNEKFVELSTQAQMSTDDKAKEIADRQLYHMMMQDTQKYADLGEELSLRDLNKYQFRRNRPDGELPVSKVGEK